MSAIRDKELATQIIKTYNAIKGSYETFNSFMEIKQKKVDKLINKPEVQKFLTNDADYSTAEEWTFFFKFPEGIQFNSAEYISPMTVQPVCTTDLSSRLMKRHLPLTSSTNSGQFAIQTNKKPHFLYKEIGLSIYSVLIYASSATTSKGTSTETSLCNLTIAL